MAAASSILRGSQHRKRDSLSEQKSYWIGQNSQYLEREKKRKRERERDRDGMVPQKLMVKKSLHTELVESNCIFVFLHTFDMSNYIPSDNCSLFGIKLHFV